MHDLTALQQNVHNIAADLEVWDDRGKGPNARARQYASQAVDTIDLAIGELHVLRAALISEIRTDDAATNERADELLKRRGLHEV